MNKTLSTVFVTVVATLLVAAVPRDTAVATGHRISQVGTHCSLFPDRPARKGEPDPGRSCQRFAVKHKRSKVFPDKPAIVRLAASAAINGRSAVTAAATDPDGDSLFYTYSTTGGRISGEGPSASWDLSSVSPGTYTLSVEVDDGCGCITFSSTNVTVQ